LSVESFADNTKASKEFSFVFAVLSSLHYCNWAREYALQLESTSNMVETMTNLMTQNAKFEQAKAMVADYSHEKEERYSTTSKGMVVGMEMHIEANNTTLDMLRRVSNSDLSALKNFDYEAAKINDKHKQAWEMLSTASMFVIYSIVQPAASSNPTGQVPFRISERERVELLQQLDKLFADDLKKYYAYRGSVKKGLKGNPNDQTWVIFAVDRIRDTLSAKTYEEGMKKQ
jgi:hypothetical protein